MQVSLQSQHNSKKEPHIIVVGTSLHAGPILVAPRLHNMEHQNLRHILLEHIVHVFH